MNLKEEIERRERMEEDYPGQRRESIRQLIVQAAHDAAFQVVFEFYEGEGEYRYLLTLVSQMLFNNHVVSSFGADLLRSDLKERLEKKR